MGSFHLTKMSLRNLLGKPATKMYPTVVPQYHARTKGHVVIDIETCILCSICEKKCPALAIIVDKPAGTWTIDPFACVQCLTCIRACPKDSLTMDTAYAPAATAMWTHVEHKPVNEAYHCNRYTCAILCQGNVVQTQQRGNGRAN
jgi:formate hydrogenlyase subunit 6/NADH:ubiquinone oxidoreductase subunit I